MPFFLTLTDHTPYGEELRGDEKLTLADIISDFVYGQYSIQGTRGLLKILKVTPELGLCEDFTEVAMRAAWQFIDANEDDCSGNELRLLKEHNLVPDHVERIEGGLWIYTGAPAEGSLAAEHGTLRAVGGRVS